MKTVTVKFGRVAYPEVVRGVVCDQMEGGQRKIYFPSGDDTAPKYKFYRLDKGGNWVGEGFADTIPPADKELVRIAGR